MKNEISQIVKIGFITTFKLKNPLPLNLIELEPEPEPNFIYYMRRGQKYYFKNKYCKLSFTISDINPYIRLKYGEEYALKIEKN